MNLKSQQSRDYVLKSIRDGVWQNGDRLPSERELAETLDISHLTVRRGLADLVKQGVIVKKPGSGNFVADPKDATPIAVVFPSYLLNNTIRQPAVGLEMQGLEKIFDSRHYSLQLMWYRPEHFWEDVGEIIISRGIKGAVLWGHAQLTPDPIERLLDKNIKIVGTTSDLLFRKLGIATFDLDRTAIQAAAISGLVKRGHTNIAVARYVDENQHPFYDLGSQLSAVRENSLVIHPLHCISQWQKECADYSSFDAIFEMDCRPTAVVLPEEVAANDMFRRCYQRGVRIPEDLSIVALSDTAPHTHPVSLSAPDSIECYKELAVSAGEYLRKLLENNYQFQKSTLLAPQIIWRDSVLPSTTTYNLEAVETIDELVPNLNLEPSLIPV